MTTARTTTLRLHPDRSTLSDGVGPELVIGLGVDDIARSLFLHDPPTAIEIEQAIDVVEDALAATGLRHDTRGELSIVDAVLLAPLGLTRDGMHRTRDEVEERFDRLAAAAIGRPDALAGMVLDRAGAAALLLLRECMHHLGYESVRRVAPAALPPASASR